ncbi:MAG TPA: cytochrome c [Candidatus Acidoferrales bacterium]|nr:cytochrome c [Candidatus Acidoferrales bacterium]
MISAKQEKDSSGSAASAILRCAIFGAAMAGVFAFLYASGAIRAARAAGPDKTTEDGVFTTDQAARGRAQYSQNCSTCHMDDLSGSGQALPLAGDAFMDIWEGHSVGELVDLVQSTMPQDKPGSLTPDACVDVVTYLLQYNQFPAGKDELKNDPDTLKSIIITKKNKSQTQ